MTPLKEAIIAELEAERTVDIPYGVDETLIARAYVAYNDAIAKKTFNSGPGAVGFKADKDAITAAVMSIIDERFMTNPETIEAALLRIIELINNGTQSSDSLDGIDMLYQASSELQKLLPTLRSAAPTEEQSRAEFEVFVVKGGFMGEPFNPVKVATTSSEEEAERVVAQYQKRWENVYHLKRLPEQQAALSTRFPLTDAPKVDAWLPFAEVNNDDPWDILADTLAFINHNTLASYAEKVEAARQAELALKRLSRPTQAPQSSVSEDVVEPCSIKRVLKGLTADEQKCFTVNWLRGNIVIPDEVKLRIWMMENGKRGLSPNMTDCDASLQPTPQDAQPMGEVAEQPDERTAFEARYQKWDLERYEDGNYKDSTVLILWKGWEARSELKRESGWQPIETAPFDRDRGSYSTQHIPILISDGKMVKLTSALMRRHSDGMIGLFGDDFPAKYWMPAPEAPTNQIEDGEPK